MSVKKDLATIEGHLEPLNHEAGGISFDNTGTVLTSDNLDGVAKELVKGPSSSTDNAITRYDATTGKLVQDSKALVQDGGAVQALGYVGKKEIDDAVVLPDKHYMIASGLTITLTGSITIGADSELLLI